MTKSRGILRPRRRWSGLEVELLRRNYADSRTDDLAIALDRSLTNVYQKARKLGLEKSEDYLASPAACRLRRGDNVGAEHRFKAGQSSWSKGTKGRVGVQEGCRATQYKKGAKPHTWKPVGSLRVNADGYLDRKIGETGYPPRDWVTVHRLVWIAANGPIPEGHVVVFRPGRRTAIEAEITLDVLELITRQALMLRNTIHHMPPELADVARLRGRLTRAINERSTEGDS